jgi:hypothetical protein
MALPWVETVEFQSDSKVLDRGHPLPPSFFENCSFRALDGLLFAQHEAAYEKKIFADALAWSASIAVHRAAVPYETPGAWQLPLLFGALPSWERALEKEWSNPSFDHQQLRKTKEKKRSPSLACHGSTLIYTSSLWLSLYRFIINFESSTQNYPLTVFDLSHIINQKLGGSRTR